jgi:CBS domain-containing protein
MAQAVRDVMTASPVTMSAAATAVDAARAMRDANIGDVVVLEDRRVRGIVTDRDIVVRGVADGRDPAKTSLADICSSDLTTVSPSTEVGEAIRLMREKALRRLPVVEDGRPVGIVSLGDLAVERDRASVLGAISAAPPNR